MRAFTLAAAALVAVTAFAGSASAAKSADPLLPFPAMKVGPVFVAAHTLTNDGVLASWFKPGDTVTFRAYAIDTKTKKLVLPAAVMSFYVTIPNQPNVKLKFDSKMTTMKDMPWTGTWAVPAEYPIGQVPFKVLIKLKAHRTGSFVQMPVASAMLTISGNSLPAFGPAPTDLANAAVNNSVAFYVDSVNGTRPAGAAPRLVGCSQTNVFKRGEQFVLRAWAFDLKTGAVLDDSLVQSAKFSIAGQPDTTLNWGAHGATGLKVWFWTNAWNIPKDFPLGTTAVKVTYTLEDGRVATYQHDINIIP